MSAAFPQLSPLLKAARRQLVCHPSPPQRYGTAFHVRPPIQDIRDMQAPDGDRPWDLKAWAALPIADRERIVRLPIHDTYLAWHLLQGKRVATRLTYVPPGQTQTVRRDLAPAGSKSSAPAVASHLEWIVLGEGATLVIDEGMTPAATALKRTVVWQHAASTLRFTALRSSRSFLNEQLDIQLLGKGAAVHVVHLTQGTGTAQLDIGVKVHHRAPETQSTMSVRTVADDRSINIYRGRIVIERIARGSVGYQQGRALLAATAAVADIVPELVIHTNDVRCSHGVTTTHLDDEKLFYLRSRGLSEVEARQLSVRSFYEQKLALSPEIRKALHMIA